MGNALGIIAGTQTSATVGSTVPLTMRFSFGSVLGKEQQVLLVLYDLEQYLFHQKSQPNGESGLDIFNGKKTTFAQPPPHEVKAGTGILLMAELKFGTDPKVKVNSSFVESVSSRKAITQSPFKFEIRCPNCVDENGTTLSPRVVDEDVIALTGPAQEDFDFLTQFGPVKRKLTFRFLSVARDRVLVSQFNPKDSNKPFFDVRYDGGRSKLKLFIPADEPKPAPSLKATPRPFDLTGEYIERIKDAAAPEDPVTALAPAVLRVHHVGRAVCGWYSPLPSQVLEATTPSTVTSSGKRIYPPDIATTIFSTDRMVFVLGEEVPPPAGAPSGKESITHRVEMFFTTEKVDPDILFARRERADGGSGIAPDGSALAGELEVPQEKRVLGTLRFEFEDIPLFGKQCRLIEANVEGTERPIFFDRMSANARLSWSTVAQLLRDNPIPPDQRKELVDSVTNDMVEAIPPGTLAEVTGFIASQEMEDLILDWAVKRTQPLSQRMAAEGLIDDALESLESTLKSITNSTKLSPVLIAHVRAVARHHVIQLDNKESSVLSALEKISDDIIERELAKDPQHTLGSVPLFLEETIATLSTSAAFRGFAAFNIRPERGIKYKFTFQSKSKDVSALFILHGSAGGCLVDIEKLDPATGKEIDPVGFPKTRFAGSFIAGALGIGVTVEIAGAKKIGSTETPPSCEIISLANIKEPKDFDGASFTFVTSGFSSSATGGPNIGISTKSQTALFSITTNGLPPVTLEAEIDKLFEVKPKTPSGKDIFDHLKKWGEAVKEGDPKKVPAAKFRAALNAFSICKGSLLFQTDAPPIKRPIEVDEPMDTLVDKKLDANVRILGAHFARGSAVVTDDARKILELKLAVLRKLVEYPGWMDIEGTASPEWGTSSRATAEQKNVDLSQHRANAIRAAIFDATGQPGDGAIPKEKDIQSQGKGSKPFQEEFVDKVTPGLHVDPFSPSVAFDENGQAVSPEAKEVVKDRADFYPGLRRVDIAMNGVFAARILAE